MWSFGVMVGVQGWPARALPLADDLHRARADVGVVPLAAIHVGWRHLIAWLGPRRSAKSWLVVIVL
jgi:hypothetical protein